MFRSVVTIALSVLLIFHSYSQTGDAKLANEYFQQGELEKAEVLYEKLVNRKENLSLIHANYLQLLIQKEEFKKADRYLKKAIDLYPNNLQFLTDQIFLQVLVDDIHIARKSILELKQRFGTNAYQLALIAQHFLVYQMEQLAIDFYLDARIATNRRSSYALELAAIYRAKNQKELMIEEYLRYAEENPNNLAYIKNIFQNFMEEESDQIVLESSLIEKIQKFPDEYLYTDLLIWLEIQRKNFDAAFLQAKALDRRFGNPGNESMKIGYLAYDNESWEEAITIFTYVASTFPDYNNYLSAKRMLIRSREGKIRNTYPVDRKQIEMLVQEYQDFISEQGINNVTLDCLKNQAELLAFYLSQYQQALSILNQVVDNRLSSQKLIAESKLDMGDIYLLKNEPWEATLIYSQVEKLMKNSPLGYEAKYRNARLNYYTGNFALAKSHLDILKLATTREISNDAIALSLLINDNTALDSSDVAMIQFAQIELLKFQHQNGNVQRQLLGFIETYKQHSLIDEAYWLLGQVYLENGSYQLALDAFSFIVDNYPYDILSDDAFYQKCTITQDFLGAPDEALNLYTAFLKNYPGSKYVAEARKRVRQLRSNSIN